MHERKSHARTRLKRFLPARTLVLARALRNLSLRDQSVYWRLRLQRAVGAQRNLHKRPAAIRSVLFLCHGNIIRSPMAEALMKQRLSVLRPDIVISSAGLHAQAGRPADARAQVVAREFGVSLDDHRAAPLTGDHVRRADLILGMDALNEAELLGRYPEATSKGFTLGAWLGGARPLHSEIFDPYDGDEADVRRCYELVQSAIGNLTVDLFS